MNKKSRKLPKKDFSFFVVAALAMYERDGAAKQRTVNIILQCDNPLVTQSNLTAAHNAVVDRVMKENNTTPGDVKDVVLMSISFLGTCTEEEFYDEADNKKH